MAKSYITLDTRIDSFKDEFNNLVNKVGDLSSLTTSASGDSDLVQAINEHSAELGTITAGAMGTTASTVSTAVLELDTEADSDRSNFANNIRTIMLDPTGTGTSREVTASANNSTNETTFLTFVDGATGSQAIETDTGLTYNPSTGLITAVSLAAATLDISGNVDIDGTLEVGPISGTSADFDGGVTIDNMTINGAQIDISSGDLTVDVVGDIILDADGADILFKDGGTHWLNFANSSGANITSMVSDADILFRGNDGGSIITALTLDMSAAGAATFNDKIIATELDISGNVDIDGSLETDGLSINGTNVTSTAAELNILDGSATSATSTTIVDADRVIVNDNGTMVQVAVTDLAAYFDDEITAMPNLVSTGALNSGSITSGFGTIDIGSSTFTTTGIVNAGAITVGSAVLSEAELEILDGATVTTAELNLLAGVSGLVQADFTKLAAVTTSATELNIMNGSDAGGASSAAITVVDTDAFVMNDGGTMRQVDVSLLKAYFGQVAEGTALSTIDINGAATITSLQDADEIPIHDNSADSNRNTAMSTVKSYVLGGKVTDAAQTNITTLGRLDSAQIDDIKINGSTISTLSGTDLNITPLAGQQIVLDNTIAVDAGVITGATSITSTAFVGTLTGSISGTAPIATAVTAVADGGAAEHFVTFLDAATGTQQIKTDAGLKYNPNTNTLTATTFDGAVTGGITGNAATATTLATTRAISITGDVTATGVNFNGSAAIALNTSLANNAVVTATIAADAVTGAKIPDNAINSEHYTDGSIDRVHLAADIIDGTKIANDVINSEHYVNASVDFAHMQNVTGNSVLVRNASSSGVISSVAVADTKILIGDGTGFGAFALSGDVTMTNAGVTNIGADKVGSPELNTLRTFTLKDSSGSTLFTMFGAGA